METPVVNPGTTQEPASPVNTDNLANLTATDIAKQIEALQSQQVSETAPEPGINQEAAPPVPPETVAPQPAEAITQAEPQQKPPEPVGLEELERVRLEAETYKKRYADSTREAQELLARTRALEAQTQQAQEQQRRHTDEEVDAYVEQYPQYSQWGKDYKKESLILEVKESVRKEQDERERTIRYNTESNNALERAKREFPEAFKPGTQLQKLAAEIYASRPSFKNDPQGVYFAAELAKARLIPASSPAAPSNVPNQVQTTGKTPLVETGNSTPAQRIDLNNLSPEVVAKMSISDLAKILPKVEQY
jgi:type II secretory pathway pseudopilin PulG